MRKCSECARCVEWHVFCAELTEMENWTVFQSTVDSLHVVRGAHGPAMFVDQIVELQFIYAGRVWRGSPTRRCLDVAHGTLRITAASTAPGTLLIFYSRGCSPAVGPPFQSFWRPGVELLRVVRSRSVA